MPKSANYMKKRCTLTFVANGNYGFNPFIYWWYGVIGNLIRNQLGINKLTVRLGLDCFYYA